MLLEINKYIDGLEMKLDLLEQLDLLFNRLCDKYSSNESNHINSIKFILFDRFEYNPMERNEKIKKLCEERDGQNNFRDKLIKRDKNCLITSDNYEICEACHIIPYSELNTFNISNGLLLNRCFHKMFDKYMWSIDEYNCIIFSSNIIEKEHYKHYVCYNGKKINIQPECKKYLKIHMERFLELNKIST